MSFNILDAVKKHLSPDLIAKASAFLGESDSAVGKAISGILPAVLGGLVSKSASGKAGADEVFNLAKESNNSGFLGNISNVFNDGGGLLNKGVGLIKNIFGDKADGIIDTIANATGIKKSSATSLIGITAPAALSTIGKQANDSGLDASGLASLLSSQKNSILNMLPSGLSSLASSIGLANVSGIVSSISDKTNGAESAIRNNTKVVAEKSSGIKKWLFPILFLAGALFAVLYFSKACNRKPATAGAGGSLKDTSLTINTGADVNVDKVALPSLSLDSVSGIVNYDLGHDVEFSLPNGVKFMAAESGFESVLLNFIQTGFIDTVNKSANWFNMFDVQFKSGGNEYNGKAEAQLKNCAAILKAYPSVKIKLGGYTDNTGSSAANIQVSQLRADKVRADLIKMGTASNQIVEALGYGPEFPICEANDTKECQARNRRVACKVAVK